MDPQFRVSQGCNQNVGQGAFSSEGLNGEEPTFKFIQAVGKDHFLAAIELMWSLLQGQQEHLRLQGRPWSPFEGVCLIKSGPLRKISF